MASRVEKYHSEQDYATERSQKNQNLYDAISELDKTTEKDLAKIYRLFQDFDARKQSLDDLYLPKPKKKIESRESLYSFLDDVHYDPFDLMVQRQYDQEIEEKDKIEELVDTITDHLDILEKQESHLRDLKDLTCHSETRSSSDVEPSFLKTEKKKREVDDLFEKGKSLISSRNIASHLFKDEKEEEKKFNLKVKRGVLVAFILNSILIVLFIIFSIR